MKDVVLSILVLLGIASIIFMVGTAGALDQNMITFSVSVKRILIAGIVLVAAFIAGKILLKDEEEDIYDRL